MAPKKTTTTDPGTERQAWIERVTNELRARFARLGYTIPAEVRASIGFASTGARSRRIGECWATEASADAHAEIFLVPTLACPVTIVATLAHELVHATVGIAAGHGRIFRDCAVAIGLEGKMTATSPNPAFTAWIREMLTRTGDYPAGALAGLSTGRKKQVARMIKAECGECGYTVRLARKWIEDVGAPHCPDHGAMTIEGADDDGEGE